MTRGDFVLLQFRVKNYRSIGDEIVLDMKAFDRLGEHKYFLVNKNNVNILTAAALFGANASGKSNVLDALYNMRKNVILSASFDEKQSLFVTPFLFDEEKAKQPSEFEVHFAVDAKEYKYGFIISKEKIYEEWLYSRKLSKNKTKWKMIFERREDKIYYSDLKKFQVLENYSDLIINNKKMLALSFFSGKNLPGINEFIEVSYFFMRHLFIDSHENAENTFVYEMYYEDKDIKKGLVNFLREFDPCIEDIVIKKEEDRDGNINYLPYTIHNGKEYTAYIESDGTLKLINIFIYIKLALESGGVLIVDELDCKLHPLIMRRIIYMFHNSDINKKGAQIIFSSHNLIVLDNNELRRDEIWFVEKNEEGYTDINSLADFKIDNKIFRSDMDYGKHYLAGRFGAIPYLNNEE